jgi:Aspartyl protease
MKIRMSPRMAISLVVATMLAASPRLGSSATGEIRHVPFMLSHNRVIIPTRVNGSRPLDLILDTGMRFDGVYLFNRELAKEIDMTGAIEVRVPGAGSGQASTAQMIESGTLAFGDVTVDSQRVIISQSAHTQGFPTGGVIGWNLFGHYTVEIDYDQERITLHDTTALQLDSTWTSLPIVLKNDLPFLECRVEVVKGEIVPMTVYIDLASGDALELLVKPGQRFSMPDSLKSAYLGTGLSGDVRGSVGRSEHLWVGEFMLSDIRTSFAPAEIRSKQQGADGILGNDCIRRFNVIFDYAHKRLHVRPSKYFAVPFE